MTIHWLQHVEFEGLGCIEPWLEQNGHAVSCTRLWAGDELPAIGTIDGLIVMGGPMGVYDEDRFPWLADEKACIREAIAQQKPVLGICLGAQLIADALGSRVWKNDQKEIGFFPILGNPEHEVSNHWKLPDEMAVFHWHGDTFDLPAGAIRLASSEATENQAFIYQTNVLALQFHLETTPQSLLNLYDNCRGEITDGPFIQTLEKMRPFFPSLGNANRLMCETLNRLFNQQNKGESHE